MSAAYTKEEICTSYRQAKRPEKQVDILAQLCGYPIEQIENILRSCGFAVKSSGCEKAKTAKISWTTKKYRELERCLMLGMSERDIAANLHCTVGAVKAAKYRLKKQKAAEAEVSAAKRNEPAPAGTDTSSKHNNTDIMIPQNGGFVKGKFYV